MIPHIRAEDMNGAYYGQGYFHAQTRLFQLQKQRIAAKAQLSATFDAGMVGLDIMLKSFRLHSSAIETEPTISPMAREAIQAYADGVNDYVENLDYGLWYSGHPEFYIFEIEWEPYTVIDALAIM